MATSSDVGIRHNDDESVQNVLAVYGCPRSSWWFIHGYDYGSSDSINSTILQEETWSCYRYHSGWVITRRRYISHRTEPHVLQPPAKLRVDYSNNWVHNADSPCLLLRSNPCSAPAAAAEIIPCVCFQRSPIYNSYFWNNVYDAGTVHALLLSADVRCLSRNEHDISILSYFDSEWHVPLRTVDSRHSGR